MNHAFHHGFFGQPGADDSSVSKRHKRRRPYQPAASEAIAASAMLLSSGIAE
jgi:hypothetical protein